MQPMTPQTDGFYLSDQFITEEMHAGARHNDEFFRYIKFFADGHWLWSDRNNNNFDFTTFIKEFDLAHWQCNHKKEDPPTTKERDHGFLFQFGTYNASLNSVYLTFHSVIAQQSISSEMTIVENAEKLVGWEQEFHFSPYISEFDVNPI